MLTICKIELYVLIFLCHNIVLAQYENVTIEEFAWLEGHWTGEGFGGIMEEHWSPPSDNVMMGMFKHSKDGKITFYEFFTIIQEDGKWALRLKHFNPDFVGWEEKTDYLTFPLVSIGLAEIAFDGLVMKKISDDQMEVRLSIQRKGEVSVEQFLYTRVVDRLIYE